MIVISGDCHGEVDYRKLDNHKVKSHFGRLPDYLIVAGDFGVPWSDNPEDERDNYLRKWYEDKPYQVIVVPGNHENYNRIEKMPKEIYLGAKVRRYGRNIVFVEKNQVLNIEEKTFYCLGGAESTDKQFRVLYQSWWPQEDACYEDFLKAKSFLRRVKHVDYVITHTAPEKIVAQLGRFDRMDGTSKLLTYLDENLKFRKWFFGHFHEDVLFEEGKYTCLYNQLWEAI